MRNFLIHKNVSLYYWLKRRVGKERAFKTANTVEKIILNIDYIFFVISFSMIAGIFLLWIFLNFLNLRSFF